MSLLSLPLLLWSSLITVCFVISQITVRTLAKPVFKTVRCHVRETKRSSNNGASVWCGLQDINCLMTRVCLTTGLVVHSPPSLQHSYHKTACNLCQSPHWPADKPSEHDVSLPVRQKIKKAPSPDCMSPYCLKVCSDQLAPHLHTDVIEILHHKINWLQAYCSDVCGHPSRVWCLPTWKLNPM